MAHGIRRDGRGADQVRACAITLGGLPGADGGATVTLGDTWVTVGIQGPRPPRGLRFECPDGAVLEVLVSSVAATAGPSLTAAAAEDALRAIFTPVILRAAAPRTVITIAAHIVHDGGSALAALILATTAAAIDAGLPLATTVVAAASAAGPAAAMLHGGSTDDGHATVAVLVDPTNAEETAATSQGVFAFDAHALASSPPLWCDWSSGAEGGGGASLQAAARAAAAASAALLHAAVAAKVARDATNYPASTGSTS